jgi:hypothetical protein
MKVNIENYSHHDVKLIPVDNPKRKNLWVRNDVFYVRKMINGKRVLKSLGTSDPYLAIFLLTRYQERIMVNEMVDIPKDILDDVRKNEPLHNDPTYRARVLVWQQENPGKIHTPADIYPEFSKKNIKNPDIVQTSTKPKEQHKLIDIWNNDIKHHFQNPSDETKANDRIQVIIDNIPVDTIEAIDENPAVLDLMKEKVYNHIITKGSRKGKYWSYGTIKDAFGYFKQVISKSQENLWIKNESSMLKKLEIDSRDVKGESIDVLPLDEIDLPILFKALSDIKKREFKFMDEAMGDMTNPIHQSKEKGRIKRIRQYPDALFYSSLISFFTGSRANASITLRHSDIDIEHKSMSIAYDAIEDEENNEDKRSKKKKLKTKSSIRIVSIAPKLVELGLIDYLKQHELKYGKEAFIFEEAIKTKNDYRDSYVNETFNQLLILLKIKPSKDSGKNKTFHSIKKAFYTFNRLVPGIDFASLKEIAGNKNKVGDVANDWYVKPTWLQQVETINKITYPGIEQLYN